MLQNKLFFSLEHCIKIHPKKVKHGANLDYNNLTKATSATAMDFFFFKQEQFIEESGVNVFSEIS